MASEPRRRTWRLASRDPTDDHEPTIVTSPRPHALVTGAASGLGLALASRLAREGWHVGLADIDADRAAGALAQVRAAGGEGQAESLDVASQEQWASLVARLRGEWPALDLVVNNAGVAASGEVGTLPIDDWDWLLSINLRGVILGCHSCVEWLKANPRGGAILNTASLAGIGSMPTMGAYNVSKAGVISLSETLYGELRPHGVSVTVACPSFFQTNLLAEARIRAGSQRETAERLMRESPLSADDVARRCLRAVRRKELYVVPPGRARNIWWLKRLSPAGFHRHVAKVFARGEWRKNAAKEGGTPPA